MPQLFDYFVRITPGLSLAACLLLLLPRSEPGARLCVHIGLFILVRDAMTPVGLWHIGTDPTPSIRLSRDPIVLTALALATLGLLVVTTRLERALTAYVTWSRGPWLRAIALGGLCAGLIAAPGLALAHFTPSRSANLALSAPELSLLLVFALVGNAYEELLFRGFLQGSLTARVGESRAAWIAGLGFAFGHVSLATTVTSVGAPLLVFTAYEGLICAQLYRRAGLLGATLAHGGGIFLLASGL